LNVLNQVDDVNLLWYGLDIITKNAETLLQARKEKDLELNVSKTEYIQHQQQRQNIITLVINTSFENVSKFKYLRTTKTHTNEVNHEIKSRIHSGNAFINSILKLLSSRLLSNAVKIRIYKKITLPVLWYGCETWSLTLKEELK
jgi:hypothetical protein